MEIIIPIISAFGVAIPAFCVWLTVRIVNRRERWAKWTAAAVFGLLPVLYVGSFGPACWCAVRRPLLKAPVAYAYWPLTSVARAALCRSRLHDYADIGTRNNDDRIIVTEIVRFNF
jgi:hypothetical protein